MAAMYLEIVAILVTGATGDIVRRVVDRLIALGANDIRALTTERAAGTSTDRTATRNGKPEAFGRNMFRPVARQSSGL